MSEEEQKVLVGKRSSRHRKNEQTPLQRMNRKLNIAIAIVSALIILVTTIILNNRETVTEQPAVESPSTQENEQQPIEETPVEQAEPIEDGDNIISQSADANVKEVWTNPAWQPYPTKQTEPHTSVFELNHPDYEEKLAAAFSVLPIEQETSYVTSARNNGDAKSARIVVTNKDKSEGYRVIIQWVEQEGWLPLSVDVLYNVDGVK